MPPKKSTSVTRNIHIPRDDASLWAGRSAKWWRSSGGAPGAAACASANGGLLASGQVVVRPPRDDRGVGEVFRRRRRRRLPLEAGRAPRVLGGVLAVAHRPEEVDE